MKAIIIYRDTKPVYVCGIRELTSNQFLAVEKEAKENAEKILSENEKEKSDLLNRIAILEKEIKLLKGEE